MIIILNSLRSDGDHGWLKALQATSGATTVMAQASTWQSQDLRAVLILELTSSLLNSLQWQKLAEDVTNGEFGFPWGIRSWQAPHTSVILWDHYHCLPQAKLRHRNPKGRFLFSEFLNSKDFQQVRHTWTTSRHPYPNCSGNLSQSIRANLLSAWQAHQLWQSPFNENFPSPLEGLAVLS